MVDLSKLKHGTKVRLKNEEFSRHSYHINANSAGRMDVYAGRVVTLLYVGSCKSDMYNNTWREISFYEDTESWSWSSDYIDYILPSKRENAI